LERRAAAEYLEIDIVMDEPIKVRFKLAWSTYRVGDVIQPPGTLRQFLVCNGYADVVAKDPPPQPASKKRKAVLTP
jgi:hypothetical protein